MANGCTGAMLPLSGMSDVQRGFRAVRSVKSRRSVLTTTCPVTPSSTSPATVRSARVRRPARPETCVESEAPVPSSTSPPPTSTSSVAAPSAVGWATTVVCRVVSGPRAETMAAAASTLSEDAGATGSSASRAYSTSPVARSRNSAETVPGDVSSPGSTAAATWAAVGPVDGDDDVGPAVVDEADVLDGAGGAVTGPQATRTAASAARRTAGSGRLRRRSVRRSRRPARPVSTCPMRPS